MYKVMLVDDDYPVIEFLKQEIPWEELQLKLTAAAGDGLSALEQAKLDMPDLLITDIGMPGMNGLELIAELKRIHPELQVIILSCHDDFQFARQAVQLSVRDYVLKESMEVEEISDLLRKLAIQIDDRRNRDKRSRELDQLVSRNRSVLKEKLLRSLLDSPILNEAEWQERMWDFGVRFDERRYVPVIGYMNRYGKQLARYQSAEALQYAVNNVIAELLDEAGGAVCFFQLNRQELLLLLPAAGAPQGAHRMADCAAPILKRLQSAARTYIKVGLSFVVAEHSCGGVQELKRAVQKLHDLAEGRYYLPEQVIAVSSRLEHSYAQEDIFQYCGDMTESFKSVLTEGRSADIRAEAARWTRFFADRLFRVEDVKSLALKVTMDYQMKLRAAHSFDSALSLEQLHKAIISTESIHELEDVLDRFLHSLYASLSELSSRSTRKDILAAQKYVAEHLHLKITLEETAEMLHLNASYFSRLFKKETKESFIVYVTRMKMERAKEWLETTDKPIEEIAYQLGYEKKSYFNKCFKSLYGEAPSRLRAVYKS